MRNAAIVGLLASGLLVGGLTPAAEASVPASDSAKKKCRKGYRLVTVKKKVRRHGRRVTIRVKRCRKVRRHQPGPAPLFAPPGRQLNGVEARGFLGRYLAESRFTSCPAGWPNCAVEERYSHFGNGAFYYCRLSPSPGSDIRFSSGYTVTGATVNADGSWAFDEVVPSGGNPSYYSWRVSKAGVATGGYRGPDGSQQSIGPLQWVREARDCSF